MKKLSELTVTEIVDIMGTPEMYGASIGQNFNNWDKVDKMRDEYFEKLLSDWKEENQERYFQENYPGGCYFEIL